jgi:hypothetical protein
MTEVMMRDQPTHEEAASSADPATALRAAALSTLKSKRRKQVDVAPSPPTRPRNTRTNEPTIQLDYGGDEISEPSTSTHQPVPPPAPPKEDSPADVEDGEIREEGEVSEPEDQSHQQQQVDQAQTQQQEREQQLRERLSNRQVNTSNSAASIQREDPIERPTPTIPQPTPAAPIPQTHSPSAMQSIGRRLEDLVEPWNGAFSPASSSRPEQPMPSPSSSRPRADIDNEHIRPGLSSKFTSSTARDCLRSNIFSYQVNAHEYETAKVGIPQYPIYRGLTLFRILFWIYWDGEFPRHTWWSVDSAEKLFSMCSMN